MAYTTADKIRDKILGVNSTDAPDSILNPIIEDATKQIIRRVSVRVLDEELISKNADETIFETEYPFIADSNGDKIINKTDITIYTWTDKDDEDTKLAIDPADIASFHSLTGQIKLVADPDTIRGATVDLVTIDYNYYLNKMDFDLADLATAYLSARIWVERELLLVPEGIRIGRINLKHRDYWTVLDSEYEKILHLIISCPMDKVCYEKIMVGARKDTLKEEIDDTDNKVEIPEDIC